jgi:HAD superfamily hydrolase (TIGR01509 family)
MHLIAWNLAYRTLTGQGIDRIERLSGQRTETIASILSGESKGRFQAADIRILKKNLILQGEITCEPIPGIEAFFAYLETIGLKWGIASNSSHQFVSSIVNRFGMKPHVLVSAEEVPKPKPAPDIYWHCANLLDVDPKQRGEIVFFEDSTHGLKAGIAAGMRPIGIATDVPAKNLLAAGAEQVFKDFVEVLQSVDTILRSSF